MYSTDVVMIVAAAAVDLRSMNCMYTVCRYANCRIIQKNDIVGRYEYKLINFLKVIFLIFVSRLVRNVILKL